MVVRQFFPAMKFLEVIGREPGRLETIHFIRVVIVVWCYSSVGRDVGRVLIILV